MNTQSVISVDSITESTPHQATEKNSTGTITGTITGNSAGNSAGRIAVLAVLVALLVSAGAIGGYYEGHSNEATAAVAIPWSLR